MKGTAWFELILINGVGGIKGRRGLHNPELDFDGNKAMLDGLCRVAKLSCTFFQFWAFN